MRYRAEIDGLRAVAVVPVILFHAGFEIFSGGYVGVDVFFVISGYLITSIILSEMDEGRFSLVTFYERRARRILPALFFVMAVCMPFAWLWLTPRDMKDFAQSLIAVSTFSSNILFWTESGYFDTAAELKPLLHTWSLAVEEQYYILFPLFLMLTWRLGKRRILAILSIVFIISLGAGHWGGYNEPSAAFYLLPTRGWEILLGVFAALYLNRKDTPSLPALLNETLSLIGIVLIVYAVSVFDKTTPFPSLYTLLPTVGTVLLILCAKDGTLANRALGHKVFVSVGLISYSAYLWHQPLLAFARHLSLTEPPTMLLAFLCAVTFPLSYVSWRYVEKPFRNKVVVEKRFLVGSVIVSFIAINAGAVLLHSAKSGGFTLDSTAEHELRMDFADDYCPQEKSGEPCEVSDKKILIVGDSMWADARNILWSVYPATYETSQRGGCPPHRNIVSLMAPTHPKKDKCSALNAQRFQQDLSRYFGVVIINRYGWFKPTDLDDYLKYMKENGVKRVLVFGSYFGVDIEMDKIMKFYETKKAVIRAFENKHLIYREIEDGSFKPLEEKYDFTFVSIREPACAEGACRYFVKDSPFTYDFHHYTTNFAKYIGARHKNKILTWFEAE